MLKKLISISAPEKTLDQVFLLNKYWWRSK